MNRPLSTDIGDRIVAILEQVYVDSPAAYRAEARRRGITVEQLAAAAIAGALAERSGDAGAFAYDFPN